MKKQETLDQIRDKLRRQIRDTRAAIRHFLEQYDLDRNRTGKTIAMYEHHLEILEAYWAEIKHLENI